MLKAKLERIKPLKTIVYLYLYCIPIVFAYKINNGGRGEMISISITTALDLKM